MLSETNKIVYELEKLSEVTAEKLNQIKKDLKVETEVRAKLKAKQKSLTRHIKSSKAMGEVCGKALENPIVLDMADITVGAVRAKIGQEFKADIEELTRDECIEILLALQTCGFEFNDFFIQRGVDIETAKIGGRKEMWFHEHLGVHLDIDMTKGAEERMMEDGPALAHRKPRNPSTLRNMRRTRWIY
jgi:hypothetical protein